jgi:hypothetical protein
MRNTCDIYLKNWKGRALLRNLSTDIRVTAKRILEECGVNMRAEITLLTIETSEGLKWTLKITSDPYVAETNFAI